MSDREGLVIAEVDFDLREQVQTVALTGVPTPAVGDPISIEGITVAGGVLETENTCWCWQQQVWQLSSSAERNS